jgi:hypothetical protein
MIAKATIFMYQQPSLGGRLRAAGDFAYVKWL